MLHRHRVRAANANDGNVLHQRQTLRRGERHTNAGERSGPKPDDDAAQLQARDSESRERGEKRGGVTLRSAKLDGLHDHLCIAQR